MSVTEKDIIDTIAFEKDRVTLILEIYDHLPFEGKFEYDHISLLQDKLNTYMWYIDSEQYRDTYPDHNFESIVINFRFLHNPTENCVKFITLTNKQLSSANVKIV
jgi:hypothetical protein